MSAHADRGSERRPSEVVIARARAHTRTGRTVVASDAGRSRLAASLRRLGADEAAVTDLLAAGSPDDEHTPDGPGATTSASGATAARIVAG
jgi:hypothetical protein